MYSGNDSTESQNYTQWALNPSTYQNMSNEQVDWAALAQQWIIMKEAGPPLPDQITAAPPPPIISKPKKDGAEGGEAPMDVENDDESGNQWNDGSSDSFPWNQPVAPPPPHQPWGWNNTWSATPPTGPPPPTNSLKPPLLPTPGYTFGNNKEATVDNNFGYSSVSPPIGGYWTTAGTSKVIKPHNKRFSKVNVPVPASKTPPMTLDAAKRKQLPAWIREGLEKMERDKMKQIDKHRERLEKEEFVDKTKMRENAMEILKSTVKEVEQKRLSVYDDDSDESVVSPQRKSPSPPPLTYEEMMLKVRRTMTEILLKVTNREIQNICREELQRHVRKLKATDQRVSAPSGANLSAKLGLGAYEGSDESSSESEDGGNHGYLDSDSELKDIIRRRKEEFSKIERDIEHRLAEAEKTTNEIRAVSPDSDSQVDAKVQDLLRSRKSEEGTPPPKTNSHKLLRNKRQSSPSTISDSDTDRNSKDCRSKEKQRSSSSDRHTRRSRSHTPRIKKKYNSRSKRSRSSSKRKESNRKESSRRKSRYSRSRSRSRSFRSRRNRSRSRRRSDSHSPYRRSRSRSRSSRRYRRSRSRSYSNGRGKKSHRH